MLAVAASLLLAGCASNPAASPGRLVSGYTGQSTADATCIREHQEFHKPLSEAVRECGARFPDLTNERDLQRRAASSGQPLIATALGKDGQDHWYVCHLTGLHPGDYPTRTSPFRCTWLGATSPHRNTLDGPPAQPGSAPQPS